MNKLKIVALSFLLSVNIVVQNCDQDDSDFFFSMEDIEAFIAEDFPVNEGYQLYHYAEQNVHENYQDLESAHQWYGADGDEQVEVSNNNGHEIKHSDTNSITPKEAGQQAYNAEYLRWCDPAEPEDSEVNKRAKAAARKVKYKVYAKLYRQSAQGKISGRKSSKKWDQSDKGRAARKEYRQTETFKAGRRKYEQSEKFKASKKKYEQSEKFKATALRLKLKKEAQQNSRISVSSKMSVVD